MNDRHLSRGKRIDNGEWVTGYYFSDTAPCTLKAAGKCTCGHDGSTAEIISWLDEFHEYDYIPVNPATVGRCTGSRDKNNRLIFEGDRLWDEDFKGRFVVGWDDEWVAWMGNYETGGMGYLGDILDNSTEIIGNIHEANDLLEVTK